MTNEAIVAFENELSEISWGELEHAYGKATGTPDWIRALRSNSKELRQQAIQKLDMSICHQGSRYPASLAAVSPLLKLINDQSVSDRHEIILLLLRLAIGYAEEWLPEGFDVNVWAVEGLHVFGPDSKNYINLTVEIYHAVRAGVPNFRKALLDQDVLVRIASGFSLAWFKEDAELSIPEIRRSLKTSQDTSEIVNHILSLGLLNSYIKSDQDTSLFRSYLALPDMTSISVSAAIALVHTVPREADDKTLSLLLDTLDEPESPPVFHWNGGYIRSYVIFMLGILVPYMPEKLVPALHSAIQYINPGGVVAITRVLCNYLFPEKLATGASFLSMNNDQKKFLNVLAENWIDVIGENVVDISFEAILRKHGLPTSHKKLITFIS